MRGSLPAPPHPKLWRGLVYSEDNWPHQGLRGSLPDALIYRPKRM